MNNNWVSIVIAAAIAISIIVVIETLASHKTIPEGNNFIIWLEVAVLGLIFASYVFQEIVRAIGHLMLLMQGRRHQHVFELRNIVILFGSALVSAAIYFAFVVMVNNGNDPLGGRLGRLLS